MMDEWRFDQRLLFVDKKYRIFELFIVLETDCIPLFDNNFFRCFRVPDSAWPESSDAFFRFAPKDAWPVA